MNTELMASSYNKILLGQCLLVVCCVFYLIWWSMSYRPGVQVNKAGGVNGMLLLVTAVSGVVGILFTVNGLRAIPRYKTPMNNMVIIIGGIAAYIVLMLLTSTVFHRVVTTELLLIVGWVVLELCTINILNGAGTLSLRLFTVMLIVLAAAFIVSMILYVMYYRMADMKAFYAAMVPLATEGFSMLILVIMMIGSRP